MAELSWFQRNGAIFSGMLAFIALLTCLHGTISGIGAEVSGLRAEIRDDLRNVRASLDRVETKVDEVRGYLRYNADTANTGGPPPDPTK